MADPFSEVEQVQKLTTDDTGRLPLADIDKYLAAYPNQKSRARVYRAAADICEYFASKYENETISAEGVSLGRPLWIDRAPEYRRMASNSNIFIVGMTNTK